MKFLVSNSLVRISRTNKALFLVLFIFIFFLIPSNVDAYVSVFGNISSNTTWVTGEVYVVSGTVTVNSGVQLTIEPGAIVKFYNSNARLWIDGELSANGTSTSKIYFTSRLDDTVGGDTNGDGSSTTPAAGNWKDLLINSGASVSMDYTITRFGGNVSPNANVYVIGGTLSIFNSTIASASYGLRMTDGTVTIEDTIFQDLSSYGVYSLDGTGSLTLNNNSFIDNGTSGFMDFKNNGLSFSSSGNTVSGTGVKGFYMNGTISSNHTWTAQLPYIVTAAGLTVPSGKTLTVNPGTIVKFNNTGDLTVNGTISAEGTSGSPIYFTALTDDTVGGDTNGDGSSSGSNGYWGPISTSATASFDYTTTRFGGYGLANIYTTGGAITISNSTIASASYGLRTTGGTVTITDSVIKDHSYGIWRESGSGAITVSDSYVSSNSTYGLINSTGTSIDAENNWWGAASGPYNASSNPSGTGNAVSSNVDFTPWLDQWITTGIPSSGTISSNTTWSGSTPYIIGPNGTFINSGVTLTIQPGTIVKFNGATARVAVSGSLDAEGTIGSKIYFTSFKDDSVGGDTNQDGTSSGDPGDWAHLRFNSGSTASISYANVYYGGSSSGNSSMIYLGGGRVTLFESEVGYSQDKGIRIDNGSVINVSKTKIGYNDEGIVVSGTGQASIYDSWIFSNTTIGIDNISSYTVDAENNWWGHYTGPYNLSSNPSGLGDAVSVDVDFSPWHHVFEIGSSAGSVNNGKIKYTASTSWNGQWDAAVDIWNAEGPISIVASTSFPDLDVIQDDIATASWLGYWDPNTTPDKLTVDTYWMTSYHDNDGRLNIFLHELGHALGLGHSYYGNVMYGTGGDGQATTLGTQDQSDYHFLWGY